GMGEAMCRRFAALGASVVVADIDAPRTEVVAEDIGALGVVTDVAEEAQIIRLVDATLAEFGRIDVFVSNAGVLWGEPHDGVTALHERGN
ncbi:SDR family NAD(P)-dependent oxidoreductase, partial [Mycobacterium timonense]